MPIPRKCADTGALIFDLTDEEKGNMTTLEDVAALKKQNEELLARIEKMEAMLAPTATPTPGGGTGV